MQHLGLDSCIVMWLNSDLLACTVRWLLHVLFRVIIWASYSKAKVRLFLSLKKIPNVLKFLQDDCNGCLWEKFLNIFPSVWKKTKFLLTNWWCIIIHFIREIWSTLVRIVWHTKISMDFLNFPHGVDGTS